MGAALRAGRLPKSAKQKMLRAGARCNVPLPTLWVSESWALFFPREAGGERGHAGRYALLCGLSRRFRGWK